MARRKILMGALVLAAVLSFGVGQASAGVIGVDLGTGLPPATLGGFTMMAFDPGSIGGASYKAHLTGGNDDGTGPGYWATWGQSYTGNVYACLPDATVACAGTLTLSLAGNVSAVYFYMEPNQFQDYLMKAMDSSGAFVQTVINGYHGSSGVGFYSTTPGSYLSSLSVTSTDTSGFAIGEFGVDHGTIGGCIGAACRVPEYGSAIQYIGMGLFGIGLLRRRFRG
jgi:hypothetical protein